MKLIITGRDKKVKRLAKELGIRLKRDKLSWELLDGNKTIGGSSPPTDPEEPAKKAVKAKKKDNNTKTK